MNDDKNTVNKEEGDITGEEFGNACALIIESLYKICMDKAKGNKVVAKQLFKKYMLEDPDILPLFLVASSHYESIKKMDGFELIQILQESIDKTLKAGGDVEAAARQIISSSEKNVRLREAKEYIAKLGKSSFNIHGADNISH